MVVCCRSRRAKARMLADKSHHAAKKEARRVATGFDVLNLTLERAGCDYIWW